MADDLSRHQLEEEHLTTGEWEMLHGALNSATYYRNREKAELTLADQAVSDAIRQIHMTMAEQYRELAEQREMAERYSELAEQRETARASQAL